MWSVRCLFTWQQLLGERVMSLWEKIDEIMGGCVVCVSLANEPHPYR